MYVAIPEKKMMRRGDVSNCLNLQRKEEVAFFLRQDLQDRVYNDNIVIAVYDMIISEYLCREAQIEATEPYSRKRVQSLLTIARASNMANEDDARMSLTNKSKVDDTQPPIFKGDADDPLQAEEKIAMMVQRRDKLKWI